MKNYPKMLKLVLVTPLSESIMKEKCICEGCNAEIILKHFEECERCKSKAYHKQLLLDQEGK